MPKASKESASETESVEGYEGHFEHFDGGYTVAFESYTQDADLTPFFTGLPDDRCQAAHWGSVVKGKVAYHFANRDEIFEAEDACYVLPGHTPGIFARTEAVELSPTGECSRATWRLVSPQRKTQTRRGEAEGSYGSSTRGHGPAHGRHI